MTRRLAVKLGLLALLAASCRPASTPQWVTLHFADPTYMAVVPISRELPLPSGDTTKQTLEAVLPALSQPPSGLASTLPPGSQVTVGEFTQGIAHFTVKLPQGQTGSRSELLAQGGLVHTMATLPGVQKVEVRFDPPSHLEAEPLTPAQWTNQWFQAEEAIDTPLTVWWKVKATSYLVPLVVPGTDPLEVWSRGPQGPRQNGFEGFIQAGQRVTRIGDKQYIGQPPLPPLAREALSRTLSEAGISPVVIDGEPVNPSQHVNQEAHS